LVNGPSDFDKIQTGDVLVIPFSDVSWTPLFSKASAVVSESGGILSHCSIVAREYGIPAVVSVTGAMTLVDGTTLAVDGYNGEVQIIEEK
jgi:pyruvate,water dikinase